MLLAKYFPLVRAYLQKNTLDSNCKKATKVDDILIVFDLDGTLIDTSHDLLDSLNFCLSTIDLEPVEYGQLSVLVGQGAKAMLTRAFDIRSKSVSDSELNEFFELFVSHYGKNMPGKSRAYDGLDEALERLQIDGVRFAICTNKHESLARLLMEKLGMSDQFVALTGGNSFSFRKPDGRHILETIKLANGKPDRTIMIGDSINDIAAAKDAGIPSIGVPFGFSDVPIADLKPDGIISHYDELTYQLIIELLNK